MSEPEVSGAMAAAEVKRRAVAGAGVVGAQGMALRVLGLVGSVVLARLLAPRDFGIVAVGTTLVFFGSFLANAGIAAALIRQREEPRRADLQAFLALQLAAALTVTAATAALAWPFGEEGWIVLVIVASLPLTVLRTPGAIVLERRLSYRPLAVVQVAETVAYFGWAIATVAVGWGVWGLASAALVRAAAGSALMGYLAPVGFVWPRPSWARVRAPLAFGARFQGAGFGILLRDQAVNLGTAAIAGLPVLGLWSLAGRIMSVPFLLFDSLWRVSYPAMARLLDAGEDPRPVIERSVAVAAIGTGFLLTPLAAAGPALVPSVFGSQWRDAADVIPAASLGLIIAGPISVACSGYLYAVGDASIVLRSVILNSAAYAAVAFALLPVLGVAALGLGWLSSSLVEAFVLGRSAGRRTGARLASPLALPTAGAAVAAGAGWAVASSANASLLSAALVGALATALYVLFLVLVRRAVLADTVALARRAVVTSFARNLASEGSG